MHRLSKTDNIAVLSLVILVLSWWTCLILSPFLFGMKRWEFFGWSMLAIFVIAIIMTVSEVFMKRPRNHYPLIDTIDPSGWD